MSEHIELQTFIVNKSTESDTEYHEISNEAILETFSHEESVKPVSGYDFFTKMDVKSAKKDSKRKKKGKKKDSTKLMDIITAELASMEPPIVENVITKIDYSQERGNYLKQTPRFQKILCGRKPRYGDAESGWRHKPTVSLSPVFPKVLENALSQEQDIPVWYVEPVMFEDLMANIDKRGGKQSQKFLDIAIKDIKFTHHHDFSLEKMLCVKLIDSYNEYCSIKQQIKETLKNVHISKKTRDNLKEKLLTISSVKKEDLRFDPVVIKYTSNFLQLKDAYFQMLTTEKQLVHKIISLWADVEMVREKLGSVETDYVLEVTESTLDEDNYKEEWMHVFETEYSDMLDRLEYEYVTNYLEYKELRKSYDAGDSERKNITKPKLNLDQNKLKDQVELIVDKVLVKDKINIFLKENKHVLKGLKIGSSLTYNYSFKMYVDNTFVCESESFTSPVKLNRVDFTDTLTIQILSNNETLKICLCEDDIEVSFTKLNLHEIRINSSDTEFHKQKFVYNKTVEPSKRNVGSGCDIKEITAITKTRLKSSNVFKNKLYTTAEVNIKIGWSDKFTETQSEAIKESMSLGRQIKRLLHGISKPTVSMLISIIENLYGKKIGNDENLINALQDACKMTIQNNDTFPIDENDPEFVRLKLLHLRNCGGFENVENKAVPLFASQISTEQLNCLQNSDEKEFDFQNLVGAEMNPIDLHRFIGAKFVEKLNIKLQKKLNDFLLRKTYKDVVRDFKDFSLSNIFSNQSNLYLDAASISKQQLLNDCLVKEQEIKITVLRAFNLSDRSVAILSEELEDDESIAGFKLRPLRPFVRLSYHGVAAQTATAIGCHPSWNHTITLKSKLAPLSTLHVNVYDECKVNLNEEVSEEEHSSYNRTVHYKYFNKWLGIVQIPLYTVLTLGSLRGTFKINTPPLLFGYEPSAPKEPKSIVSEVIQLMRKESSFLTLNISTNLSHLGGFQVYNQPVPNSEDDLTITHLNTFVTNYLNDFPSRNISLTFIDSSGRNRCVTEFLQPIPPPEYEFFPKNPKRTDSAMSKSSSSKSSRRKLSNATNEEEKESENVVDNIWRGPETKESRLSKLVDAAVRYVALIPTYEVAETHVVALTGVELLKVLHGSSLDHTLLLACYFLHLGIRCWVVTGLALPRGPSSYVLVKSDHNNRLVMINDSQTSRGFFNRTDSKTLSWFVYDAVNGERFELREIGCPLKTVSYVFDCENIWVNIQSSQNCESVYFDFSKSSDWQPVFDDPLLLKQPPVTDSRLYTAPPDVEDLRSTLEGKIKAKVQKWRPHVKTIWNRYCGSLLREMLPQWEYWAYNPTDARPALGQRLKQLMVTYRVFGFPLNLPYVNTKSIISSVKSTGVHMNDDPNVEFGLAVEVYAYPNNVLSVWVFLASITRI